MDNIVNVDEIDFTPEVEESFVENGRRFLLKIHRGDTKAGLIVKEANTKLGRMYCAELGDVVYPPVFIEQVTEVWEEILEGQAIRNITEDEADVFYFPPIEVWSRVPVVGFRGGGSIAHRENIEYLYALAYLLKLEEWVLDTSKNENEGIYTIKISEGIVQEAESTNDEDNVLFKFTNHRDVERFIRFGDKQIQQLYKSRTKES